MYIIPKPYKCEKCDFERDYSPHNDWPAPVLKDGPVCPRCYEKFLRENLGLMKPGNGS